MDGAKEERDESHLVRHGESTGNVGVSAFDLSKLELTVAGHAQSAAAAANWRNRPDLTALSPYLRTHSTAKPTIERYPDAPVEVLPIGGVHLSGAVALEMERHAPSGFPTSRRSGSQPTLPIAMVLVPRVSTPC